MEFAIDKVLDQRYRILGPLGQGGSAQVYLAEDQALGREVAVKILDQEAARDQNIRKRFVKEARALAQLAHPNICAVFDVGEVDGLPFIVMEKLEISLKALIEREGALEIGDSLRIATEVASGLAAAHSRGIVHCDMKPANVLFDKEGRAKIADFGIARTPQDAHDTPQLFATALYVAPERVEGKQPTPATDLYGLGLILYEMLVGKPPFTSSNPTVLLRDHVVRPPIPPSHLRPSLPQEIDEVVTKALAKAPDLRYRNAAEFARALSRIEGAEDALMTVRVHDGGNDKVMSTPLAGMVPSRSDSPVVALLSRHAGPIRRLFYTMFLLLPVVALLNSAGVPLSYAVLLAGIPGIVALAGYLSLGLAICWLIEGVTLFLFVPVLALLFLLTGLWLAVREYSSEQAILALAMPASVPLGLAPAVVLATTSLHGLAGILTVAWGAVMAIIVALAQGAPTSGPFVASGLIFKAPPDLLSTDRAIAARDAIVDVFRGSGPIDQRLAPLGGYFDPKSMGDQITQLASRASGADQQAMMGTIAAWVLAGAMVWVITRLCRQVMDSAFGAKRWFAVYLLATALGTFLAASLLFALFSTWRPLANSTDAVSDSVLFISAMVGAIFALTVSVIIGATKPIDSQSEDLTGTAQHVFGRA
jgi:tRNA A-37 threonylcarbamoyl transferase component Bud32